MTARPPRHRGGRRPAEVITGERARRYRSSPGVTLAEAAAEISSDPEISGISDPAERADRVASEIRSRYPLAGWKVRSIQDAAARATGTTSPSELEREVREADAADERRRGSRARARSRSARRAGRRLRGAITPPSPGSPLRGASSVRGLLAQSFGLVILFWVLRTPDVIGRITNGLRRVITYVISPRGVAANPLVIPQPVLDVAARGAERDAGRHAGAGSPAKRVEEWRPLVARFFPAAQVDKALRVMACESQGNPDARNPSSGAAGLFQHMPQWWASRSQAAGFAGRSVYDPEANVGTAAWLWSRDGWGAWSCGDA